MDNHGLLLSVSTSRPRRAFLIVMVVKIIKFLIGLVLAPLVAGEIWTLIDLVPDAAAGPWQQSWFIAFGAGLLTWLIIFMFLPRTMWLYVLGHESTHALATLLVGGKISSFQVTGKGGHVVTDRVNWWVTLAPYFVPFYALIWMVLWVLIDLWYPLKAYQMILYFGLGVLWCFHLTFTATMMHSKQTDLSSQGTFFSVVIILLINLIFFLFLFSILAHKFSMDGAGNLFLDRVGKSYLFVWQGIVWAVTWAMGSRK